MNGVEYMGFSPVSASKVIVEKYKRYLGTIFQISDATYQKQFKEELAKEHTFAQGPYLDVTDAFEKGASIQELIEKNVLPEGMSRINLHQTRPLYKHQEIALKKVIQDQNIVVSTGTGSGKTESFLIPILDHLIRLDEKGQLDEGVRALIIYPMNALANDQVERLRGLLQEYPKITYGSYTGQTRDKLSDAVIEYQKLNDNQMPPINELISREQIKKTPPHILITNYAMLEYLMLRPQDDIFFTVLNAHKWKFIVLDEAHVYNGSTGIEVSMLLSRLKARLQNENLRYILTSATLGAEEDNDEVAEFATQLCSSQFKCENIIRALRIKPETYKATQTLSTTFYNNVAELIDKEENDLAIINYIAEQYDIQNKTLEEVLYDIVLHDENYWKIRKILQSPKTVSAIASTLEWRTEEVEHFVTVASKCEANGDKLFDSRYHMFLRATDSVFITLSPSKKLFLTRKEMHKEEGKEYRVFEVATCESCHALYLIGKTNEMGILEQANSVGNLENKEIYLLGNQVSDSDGDYTLEEEHINTEEYKICACCGYIMRPNGKTNAGCEHSKENYMTIFKVKVSNESRKLTKCVSCEAKNNYGILRMFFAGQEAMTSVIGTALFEELPSYMIKQEILQEDDDTGFGVSSCELTKHQIKTAKQFIAFSDSRQAAAFYASYLDQTYRNILYKRLVVETLKKEEYVKTGKTLNQFVEDLVYQFEKNDIAVTGGLDARREAWKATLLEMADNTRNNSLAGLGLLGITVDRASIRENPKLGLTAEEVGTICDVFISNMLSDVAIAYTANLNKADKEYFTHHGVEYTYTLSDAQPKKYIHSFTPTKANRGNKRMDYLTKVLRSMGKEIEAERVVQLLEGIWKGILIASSCQILVANQGTYKVNTDKVILSVGKQWYICPKCKKITCYNVKGVCPTYKCEGKLQPIKVEDEVKNNHYYQLYNNLDIRELRIVEHTAQLDKETAYEYQKRFKTKQVDVLSCSTTFEMGVDVGSLETVFMRNMPPSPANYAQRAGRAGRSKQAAAYALTFCNKSSHDFSFFRKPENMIKGKINPPKFNIENDKIAIRHLYASALSYFWKRYPEYFAKASTMLEQGENGKRGFEVFKNYLQEHPHDLMQYLNNFLPNKLSKKFGVKGFEWIEGLMGEEGVFTKAVLEYEYETNILSEAINRAFDNGGRVDGLRERKKVYANEEILAFLSRKNVLPKYGFPVDTVEMNIIDKVNNSKLGLQLQRDLSMAIAEYAPGSQIVANNKLITSRYIRKIPNMSWKQYDYIMCKCKTLNIEPHTENEEDSILVSCKQCGHSFEDMRKNVFLIPAFGFEADGEKVEKPGLTKPEKTYRNEIAYIGYKNLIQMQQIKLGNAEFELGMSQGDEMAVLNESNFFVCEHCGYTDLDDRCFTYTKKLKHKNSAGYWCKNDGNNRLKRFSLGYRFETDVTQLRFINPDLVKTEVALSILYGVLRGISSYLNIEQNDIAGCLQYFYNNISHRGNYSLIFYDKSPGGAGHVRRICDKNVLEGILKETLRLMEQCDCGGEDKDSSCYACLRNYYNQKHHDILKRGYVIDFIKELLQ